MYEHLYDSGCDMDWITGASRVHNVTVLMESFDHLTVGQMTLKGWSGAWTSAGTGRFGGQAMSLSNVESHKSLPSTYATLIIGFACGNIAAQLSAPVMALRTAAGALVVQIGFNSSQQIVVYNGSNSVIATGTTVLPSATYQYIELKAFVNGASGTIEVHLNGVVEIASTTVNIGSTNMGQILFGPQGGVGNQGAFDDVYVNDTSGGHNDSFLGDVRITTEWPTSDGAHTDWTPSSGTAHWSLVDETTPNSDTDYVSSGTIGNIDTYGIGVVDGGATVYAVQVNLFARKDDSSARQVAPVIRQSATDYVGTTYTLGSSYAYDSQIYDKDPTGTAWTPTTINADQFGEKVIA